MQPITVVIADDDCAERGACERLLRREQNILVLAEAVKHRDAIATAIELKPRILLCSLNLASAAGCSLLLTLRRECPATLVVLLTDSSIREDRLMLALANGAMGLLTRKALRFQLNLAVRGVDRGE